MKVCFSFYFFFLSPAFFTFLTCQAQWEPDVRLTNDPGESWTAHNSCRSIAVRGALVIVVWSDTRTGGSEIFCKRSEDGGTTWERDKRLTIHEGASVNPAVSISGSVVHVVWTDNRTGNNEIFYKRSLDKGKVWGSDIRLTSNLQESRYPSLAVADSSLHVVWEDNRDDQPPYGDGIENFEIYYKRSPDNGRRWPRSIPTALLFGNERLTNNIARSYWPTVSVSGSVVHVAWSDDRENAQGHYEIFYKRSSDGGIHWEPDKRLTAGNYPSSYPSLSVKGSIVHLVWHQNINQNHEIFYKRSLDAGISWSEDIRLTNDSAVSFGPSVTTHDRGVHVVWIDYRDGHSEVYYKRSRDDGITWDADTRLTNGSLNSEAVSIAVDGKAVHIVWEDNRNGNREIYYKRNQSGNTTTGSQ